MSLRHALTRRREKDRHQECWQIYFGDVRVGTIGERVGVPADAEQWGWDCGFSPVIDRGLRASGIAANFEDARAAFADVWARYLPRCTEDDFKAWRFQQVHTAWKYAMWDAGCKMPMLTVGRVDEVLLRRPDQR